MPIFKIQNKTNYVAIPNDTARDKRLSIEARGVLAYLLTHSNTFEISLEFLQKELGVGRDKLKNIVRELKRAGYLCLSASHNKKGNFSGQEWFVYAESQGVDFTEVASHRPTEKPSDGKTDRRLNRRTENTSDILKENSGQKKIEEEKEKKERAPAPISDNEFLQTYKEFYPAYEISIHQQEIIENRIRDGTIWRKALVFWATNDYRAQSVGKICDKYDELLREQQNGNNNGTGNHNGKRPDNGRGYNGESSDDTLSRIRNRQRTKV